MPTMDKLTGVPRKDLHVFYVLDTSSSMLGTKIDTLNHTMAETVEALKDLAEKNGDANLKIAVLEFNSGCRWITDGWPEEMADFTYEDLHADGLTDMGMALKELNSKLSRHAFLDSMTGALMPVIIFMTDGYATDNYAGALEEIRKNRWFRRGTKIGFALGDNADVKMIASVVGNSEAVIKTTNMDLFRKLMRFVSVTSSMLVSQSATTDTSYSGADIIKKVDDLPKDVVVHLSDTDYDKEPEAVVDGDWDEADW